MDSEVRTSAPDVRGNVMELLAVLVGHDGPASSSRIYFHHQPTVPGSSRNDGKAVPAAITTPPSKTHPTIVVPVDVAFGSGKPLAWRAALRVWLEKSNPGMLLVEWDRKKAMERCGELSEEMERWACGNRRAPKLKPQGEHAATAN